MKKKLLLMSLAVMFQACSAGTQSSDISLDQAQQETIAQSSKVDKASKIQLAKIKEYKARKMANSICGTNDMQEVNSYNGKLGQTVDFVKKNQGAVAAMEETGSDSSSKFCSGTMISEDLYLTAGHCVESNTTSQYLAFNFQYVAGSTSKLDKQEHFKIKEVVETKTGGLDFSVLRIEGAPGKKYGWRKLKADLPAQNDLLTIIQHPSGEPKKVEVGHRGGYTAPYIGYGDLDTEPGSSGSGVLDKDGNVVAVHTNGGCGASSGENKAVAMNDIVKQSKTLKALAFVSNVPIR